jgi:hypothetical protein
MNEKEKRLDPGPLVKGLIEKSMAGKIDWQPTADRRAFIASVGGIMTFKVTLVSDIGVDENGRTIDIEVPRLDMLDEKGKPLWEVCPRDVQGGELRRLFEIARRIGNKLDDRLAGAIDALEKL